MKLHACFFTVLFLAFSGHSLRGQIMFSVGGGQLPRVKKIAEDVWGPEDRYANVTATPKKWKDASAVLIYQEIRNDYDLQMSFLRVVRLLRQRIKLQDIRAVEEYSELTFHPDAAVGIKVIKPDGKTNILDVSKAIEASGDRGTVLKMPVDDLAPGDILDYFIVDHELRTQLDEYEPVITLLSGDYPVMEQKLVFLADKKFHFSFSSLNGAPDLQPLTTSDREIAYYLIDKDREPQKEKRWVYTYLTEPTLKFKMHFLSSPYTNHITSIYSKGQTSGAMSKTDVMELTGNFLKDVYDQDFARLMDDTTFASKHDELELAYGYLRKILVADQLRLARIRKGSMIPNIDDVGLYSVDFDFVNRMAYYLREHEIEYEVIIGMPSSLGTIDELLMTDEMSVLLKVKYDSIYYLARPTLHTRMGQIPYLLEGTKAYAMKVSKSGQPVSIEQITLPVSAHSQNLIHRNIRASFNTTLDTASIMLNTEVTGLHKESYQTNFIKLEHLYAEDSPMYLGAKPQYKKEPASYREAREGMEEMMAKFKREDTKELLEQAEAWQIEELDLEISSYDKIVLESLGRYRNDDVMKYHEEFTTTTLLGKAGKNLILEIGKLMGTQVGIKDDELERALPVYMPYPRSFTNEIVVTIPDGYKVSNIDKLHVNVTNSTGGFTSSALVEGNEIRMKTLKYYTANYEEAAKWPEIVAFLNAAYDLSQQKIVLVPQ